MESGEIVEYIDDQKIICAVVMESGNQRLRMLTEHKREVKVSAQRLSQRSGQALDTALGREQLVETLRSIAVKRNEIANSIDVEELWQVLNEEREWIDVETMTGLCFGDVSDADHRSAVIRTMFRNRRFFQFRPDRFRPNSPEEMNAIVAAERKAARRQQLIDAGSAWLRAVLSGKPVERPACDRELVAILADYYLFEKESRHADAARAMMKNAGLSSTDAIFNHLVAAGCWTRDENVDLLRYRISVDFPHPVVRQADALAARDTRGFSEKDRVDLTHLTTITIDGQSTLDFDDALSVEHREDCTLVGIHISDVAHLIQKDTLLDHEALSRGSSIYMPDNRIPMTPSVLSENRLSLKKGHIRPAISTMVKVSRTGEILSYDIFPATIRVDHQLSYFEANMNAEAGDLLDTLYDIALKFREKRINQGAIQIILPEINVWLDEDGAPTVNRVNRESPGRLLVSEMMILSNWLSARFLAEKKLPAVFRSQPKPKGRILKNGTGTLFQNWMQRKLLNRFALTTEPQQHCGLGLEAYVTASSPIRKYVDLITQRQIRAALGLETAYTCQEIETMIERLAKPMADVGRIQYRRNRYWLLKYLEGRIGEKEEAIVLQRRRNAYVVLIKNCMIECPLPQSSGIDLKPEDLVQITIQHVNARNNVLSVFMG